MFRISILSSLLIFAASWSTGQSPETEPETDTPVVTATLEIFGEAPDLPTVTTIVGDDLDGVQPLGDGAEPLRTVAGVSLGRMGGHGLEPSIRGLSQTNLNVMMDGAQIHGGCPNRMDPPTSFGGGTTYDQVIVIKGVQSLRYGAGGPGGTVLYERTAPDFGPTWDWNAEVSAAVATFLDDPELAVDAAFGNPTVSFRVSGTTKSQDNYEDGDGNTVRSAFSSEALALMGWWRADERTTLEYSFDRTETTDNLFAGAGMDAPMDRGTVLRLGGRHEARVPGGPAWRATVFSSDVDHVMDNFSLRELTAPMALRVPSTAETTGGTVLAEFGKQWRWSLGLDTLNVTRRAARYAGPTPIAQPMIQSVMWPDADTSQTGFFAETVHMFRPGLHLHLGLRVDRLSSDAGDADQATMGGTGPTPRQLWAATYGPNTVSWDDTTVSTLARIEHRGDRRTWFLGLSRTVRQPDATERYLASNSSNPAMRWIGNPGLEPSAHHQLDLGLVVGGSNRSLAVTAFGDWTDDFILRDRARGQSGVLVADGASIYRNVEARRLGLEATAAMTLGKGWSCSAAAAWVRGDNRSDDTPLAQMPPLGGHVTLGWAGRAWSLASTVRMADRQTRVDEDRTTGSGLDLSETPGWAVADIRATWDIGRRITLLLGLDNAFDRTYALHLNRSNLFDPNPIRVNEPGRVAWARVRWRFRR